MYKKEFDNLFNNNKDFNAYMFWGQNDYLIESYALKVALKLANGEDIHKIYFDEYNFEICHNTLLQNSLFSSTNIVLIKTAKKIPKKDVDKLIQACQTNSSSKIIFACIGEVDFKTMAKSFTAKTSSVDVRFFIPYDNEALEILRQNSEQNGLNIDNQALHYLYNMHQKNLALCISDISKLSILDTQISSKTINQHCFGLGSVNLEDFLINLFNGVNINKDLYLLLEEGINEIQLLSRITTFTQTLFTINSYLKLYGKLNIREIWGYPLPNQIAQMQANIATKFKKEDFIYMLNFLQELELELKTNKIPDINGYIQAKLRIFIR